MSMMKTHSEPLAKMFRKASPREQEYIITVHRYYERELTRVTSENPENPEGLAAGLQEQVDEAVARQLAGPQGPNVQCRRGCSACCHLHVTVTAAEAKLARIAAQEAGWEIDTERARVQAQAKSADEWKRLPGAARACVFLTPAGLCAIYEYRPIACRKYMVVSPREDCDSILKPGQRVQQLIAPDAEIAFSAALEVFESGTLAAMLLREVDRA